MRFSGTLPALAAGEQVLAGEHDGSVSRAAGVVGSTAPGAPAWAGSAREGDGRGGGEQGGGQEAGHAPATSEARPELAKTARSPGPRSALAGT